MLRDWVKFFKELPREFQDNINSLAKGNHDLRKKYTKELYEILETDPDANENEERIIQIRVAFAKLVQKHVPIKVIHPCEDVEEKCSKADVIKFLEDKNLLKNIIKTIQSVGVVGEEIPIKIIVITIGGKLVKNKKSTSTNVHIECDTSAGKDQVVSCVVMICFVDDWIKYNSPTPTAVSYGQRVEPKLIGMDRTIGKPIVRECTVDKEITEDSILYIKDASEKFINGDDSKLLLEEESVNLPKTVKGTQVLLKWKKPVNVITTAETYTENQILRRLPSVTLNVTEEQTKSINKQQLQDDCDLTKQNNGTGQKLIYCAKEAVSKKYLKKVYVDLKEVKDRIEERKPNSTDVFMRTFFPRLLDYIKFSTALHQYQRKKVGEKNGHPILLATEEDVDIGFEVFEYIYKTEFMDISRLNHRQEAIYKKLLENPGKEYTVSEINLWKESGGRSIQQTYDDIKRIIQDVKDSGIAIDESQHPKRIYYKQRVKPIPVE